MNALKQTSSPAQAAVLRLSTTRRMMQRSVRATWGGAPNSHGALEGGTNSALLAASPLSSQLSDPAIWQSALSPVLSLIRRHPFGSLGVAAGLGAAIIVTKPWRWDLVRQQLDGLPDQVGQWATSQLADPEVRDSLLAWLDIQPHSADAANDSADAKHGSPADTESPDFSSQFYAQGGV